MDIKPVGQKVDFNLPNLPGYSDNPIQANAIPAVDRNTHRQDLSYFAQAVQPTETDNKTYFNAMINQIVDLAGDYQQGLRDINNTITATQGVVSTSSLIEIQFNVYKLVLQQDLFAKIASKGSQIFESLMRNQ